MAESSSSSSNGGIGCLSLLGLIFITLKLLGKITWSWWWVLAPFWIPAVFVTVVMVIIVIAVASRKN